MVDVEETREVRAPGLVLLGPELVTSREVERRVPAALVMIPLLRKRLSDGPTEAGPAGWDPAAIGVTLLGKLNVTC